MSRFQANTNAVLEADLDSLRQELGLRANQKADLLRELTTLAAWVVRQAAEGRVVVAQGADDVLELNHPVIERIRRRREESEALPGRLELTDDETRRLAQILEQEFAPPPALLASLRRLADPNRTTPELTWSDAPA